jgi:GNAT superfamily N-acetyltransferase
MVVIEGPRWSGGTGRTHAELRSEEADPDLAGLAAATEEEQRESTRTICHPATIAQMPSAGQQQSLPEPAARKPLARRTGLRDPGQMPLLRVSPDDLDQVAAVAGILDAARRVDDPEAHPPVVAELASEMRYGWDLQPEEHFLYVAHGADSPVGTLAIELPKRDNLQLFWLRIVVHPEHRRRGHGSAMMAEVLRMAQEAGRSILWVEAVEEDAGARKFCERFGFGYASHDARRRQVLAEVDQDAVQRLWAEAKHAAADYHLERLLAPVPEQTLQEMIEVTAAINDAPMGDLTYEDEVFDLRRMRDIEAAREGRGDQSYRVIARHRETGEVGGHTNVVIGRHRRQLGFQADTAVARPHRGHRLGLLVKIDMMRWLAEAEPQLEAIETWNNADNGFMVRVNQALGYRLSQVYATYELKIALD